MKKLFETLKVSCWNLEGYYLVINKINQRKRAGTIRNTLKNMRLEEEFF